MGLDRVTGVTTWAVFPLHIARHLFLKSLLKMVIQLRSQHSSLPSLPFPNPDFTHFTAYSMGKLSVVAMIMSVPDHIDTTHTLNC